MNEKVDSQERESGLLRRLVAACLPPLRVEPRQPQAGAAPGTRPDAVVAVLWDGQECLFACEAKGRSTPRTIEAAIAQACRSGGLLGLRPLIVVPYLSEENLLWLEREGVSGLDLCGNGIVLAADFRVWRSGRPNLFRDSAPIRNVFRGVSSLIVRSLVLERSFASLTSLRDFAVGRIPSGRLSLGTVSKVVKALEEERLLERGGEGLRLTDRSGTLRRLLQGSRPVRMARLEGRVELPPEEAWRRLWGLAEESPGYLCTVTGMGSAEKYGVLSSPRQLSLYVSDLDRTRDLLGVSETRVFPNAELVEDSSETAHFDRRVEGGIAWASPVQTWLELMRAGPREREAAEALGQALGWSGGEPS